MTSKNREKTPPAECSECGKPTSDLEEHPYTHGWFCTTCWERVDAALQDERDRSEVGTYGGCRCKGDICRC